MRMLMVLAFQMLAGLALGATVGASGVKMSDGPASYFASLTAPACPVTDSDQHWVETTQFRVLYFPESAAAAIKNPKSLILHIVFNNGDSSDSVRSIAFNERDGAAWIATASLTRWKEKFAVYWVEDPETKQSDTAGGRYFEIPFCTARGIRAEQSERFEAQSYTGILEHYGIQRPQDFQKAIAVLEEYIHPPNHGESLTSNLWEYKLHLGGNTPETREAVATEIDEFAQRHREDGFGLTDTLNFAVYQNWMPDETIEEIVKFIEKRPPKGVDFRLFAVQARAHIERDKAKRITMLRALIEKYPDTLDANFARRELFVVDLNDLGERKAVFEEARKKDPTDPTLLTAMADIYVDAGINLTEAAQLLTDADKLLDVNAPQKWDSGRYDQEGVRLQKAHIAIVRAEILVRQGRSSEALGILVPRQKEFRLGSSFYVLGQALESTGQIQAAIDAYLESVVRPSSKQKEAMAGLKRLWLKEKLGNDKQLLARIDSATEAQFRNGKYTPQLVSKSFDDVELTMLNGERIATSELRGKTVIIDFWGTWCPPCVSELKDLRDFQSKHPDVVLLAVAEPTSERANISKIVRHDKIESLRIGVAPLALWERFGLSGVPETLVIDAAGQVRAQHWGLMPDVTRTLEADFAAIQEDEAARRDGLSVK